MGRNTRTTTASRTSTSGTYPRIGHNGPVRSFRLPGPLDAWLEERLGLHLHKSFSEVIVELVHGGLRLREGYMPVHRRSLERLTLAGETERLAAYRLALEDTFGSEYLAHLDKWLEADGLPSPPRSDAASKTTTP